MIGIYKLTNVINNKYYIGQSKNIEKRLKSHISDSKRVNNQRGQTPLYDDMRFFGHDNFRLEILEECKENELDEKEKYYIEKYDAINDKKGYNQTKEAYGFKDPRIIDESHSPEIMEMHGRRIREWNLKQWQDPDYREKKSKELSELQIKRLKDPEYYNKKKADLKKATDKKKKRIAQYDKQGNLIAVFNGMREAERAMGVANDTIGKVCRGVKNRKTAKGYVWKYLQEKV